MNHWKEQKELKFSLWQINFVVFLFKLFKVKYIHIFLHPIVFFYFIISHKKRKISYDFLERVSYYNKDIKPNLITIYKHFFSFGVSLIEKIAALTEDIKIDNISVKRKEVYDLIESNIKNKKGVIFLCSHLGNIEFLRSLAIQKGDNYMQKTKLNIIANRNTTNKFNSVLKSISNNVDINIFNSETVNIDTICILKDKLDSGEVVALTCDRTQNTTKTKKINFLQKQANFPYGVFLLSLLLEHPIYYIFILRDNDKFNSKKYNYYTYSSSVSNVVIDKKNKEEYINILSNEYVSLLEEKTIKYPLQWYNFFDFWGESKNNEK